MGDAQQRPGWLVRKVQLAIIKYVTKFWK